MTPQLPIAHPVDIFEAKRYKDVSSGLYVTFDDETRDSIDLQDIRLTHGEDLLPFDNGRELFNFSHRLLWVSQLNTQDNKYQYSEEYISYESASVQGNEHLKITYKTVCTLYDDHRLRDMQILLTKEECYMVAQNLLYILETSHFRNK